jgi:DNA repair protein RecN (Recombination protein N)
MLRFLSVRHLAVIDRLEVEFGPGLNVLTGETGAGKSMLVEAIDLLVGGRASADLVRTGEDVATVQAIFDTAQGREVIVRREISAQGRSRAFIDDTLATAAALADFGASVISLHGQHEHRALVDPAEHIDLVDGFGGYRDELASVSAAFDAWRAAADALQRTQMSEREKRARIEIATFQLQEIDAVTPRVDEDEALDAERAVLANADRLSRLSAEAYGALYESDAAALTQLAIVWKRVEDLAALDARAQPYADERGDLKSRLEDLAIFLRDYRERIDAAPDRLQVVEDRLAALERLKRRYGPALSDVIARQAALRTELADLGAGEERAARLESDERQTRAAFERAAATLSAARKTTGAQLSRALETDLADLAMASCRVDVRIRSIDATDRWSRRGTDEVEFFFSPNPGEDLRPLARIASGGEMSRFMLALRLQTLGDADGHAMVFDEVDAGIGGAAADAVAVRLQALGRRQQVLCVTHLAQIAARADAHFEITKHLRAGRTHTSLVRLEGPDREREVGRMIAGAAVSQTVIESARELLARGRRSEENTKGRKGHRRGA